jgi:4-amino-4-deoxy-L-arabinose transferase-like glycosyltransferase
MRTSASWFLPTLGGTPFTHKPPLHFWLVDALTLLFGTYSTWAFVLPSIAAFAFLAWVVGRMGTRHTPNTLAAFICGSSLMVWGSAQTARMDVSFTAFLALGAWLLFAWLETGRGRAALAAGAAFGIATMIKGPMAPVIAIVLFVIELARRRQRVRAREGVMALLVMAAIPLAWFIPAAIAGGDAYRHDVIVKQTVGRALSSWVHQAPPWYYVAHLPGVLFPWFILAVMAAWTFRRGTPLQRFCLSWIAAVLLPYSLMSSKLDIYMMALLPPAAILIADLVQAGAAGIRKANAAMLILYALIGVAGMVTPARMIKGDGAAILGRDDVRLLFALLAGFAIMELLLLSRRSLTASVLAVGLVPLAPLAYAGAVLMPLANGIVSTRPLIAALERQHVPAEEMALFSCPYLWSRDFPRELERVRYASPEDLRATQPALIATSRAHANEIAFALRGYRRVESLQMIGKWFDVYRR